MRVKDNFKYSERMCTGYENAMPCQLYERLQSSMDFAICRYHGINSSEIIRKSYIIYHTCISDLPLFTGPILQFSLYYFKHNFLQEVAAPLHTQLDAPLSKNVPQTSSSLCVLTLTYLMVLSTRLRALAGRKYLHCTHCSFHCYFNFQKRFRIFYYIYIYLTLAGKEYLLPYLLFWLQFNVF